MSIDKAAANWTPIPVEVPLSMRDLAGVLVKHYGIHEGLFDLLVEFQIGTGAIGPDPTALTPGAMIGVSRVGLMPSKVEGPTTIDAAIVNPAKKALKKTKA
jgi:hypothetical protein